MQYIVREKKPDVDDAPAHIWLGADTKCHRSGQIKMDNWSVVDNHDGYRLCKLCSPSTEDKLAAHDWEEFKRTLLLTGTEAEIAMNMQLYRAYRSDGIDKLSFIIPDHLESAVTYDNLLNVVNEINSRSSVEFEVNLDGSSQLIKNKVFNGGATPKANKKTYAEESQEFLASREWRELRYKVLQKFGRRCMCCGATDGDDVYMCVDHIKPRYNYPELKLEFDNLQVLCNECNHGKGAHDETDYRNMMPEPTEENIENVKVTTEDGVIKIEISINLNINR